SGREVRAPRNHNRASARRRPGRPSEHCDRLLLSPPRRRAGGAAMADGPDQVRRRHLEARAFRRWSAAVDASAMSQQERTRIYLDHAATGWPKPERVYVAMDRFARSTGASAGRGGYRSAAVADEVIASCRRRLARLIGAPEAQRIAF